MPITLSDATSAAADWRNMPHVSGWWQFTSDAFLIAGAPDTTALFRRVCMWTIMVLRVLNGVVDFFSYLGSFSLLMAVLTPFLVLFDVVLISFCLAHIGQAEGSRRVFGFSVVSCSPCFYSFFFFSILGSIFLRFFHRERNYVC